MLALAVIYLLPKIINLPLPFEGIQILAIFIAAILTIVGYSINNTIVIYDRIRENMKELKKKNVSKEELDIIQPKLVYTREHARNLSVPLKVDGESAHTWYEVH